MCGEEKARRDRRWVITAIKYLIVRFTTTPNLEAALIYEVTELVDKAWSTIIKSLPFISELWRLLVQNKIVFNSVADFFDSMLRFMPVQQE